MLAAGERRIEMLPESWWIPLPGPDTFELTHAILRVFDVLGILGRLLHHLTLVVDHQLPRMDFLGNIVRT